MRPSHPISQPSCVSVPTSLAMLLACPLLSARADEGGRPPERGRGAGRRIHLAQWQRPSRRGGSITVVVLVCLVLIASIAGVLLRIGLVERQRLRTEHQRLQVEWLVESGIERAAAQLARSGEAYRGETWDVSASELGGRDAARVTIAVEVEVEVEGDPPAAHPRQVRVRVHGEYPREASAPARLTKQLTVALGDDPKGATP